MHVKFLGLGDPMDAFELLWPTVCAGCDVEHRGRLCPDCRVPLQPYQVQHSLTGVRAAIAASPYDSPVGVALQRAKYGRDRSLMVHLARLFARTVAPLLGGDLFDAIVDVPSPWTRRVARGFATGAVLARALGSATGLPVRHAVRIRPGRRNAGLDAGGRRRNLVGRVRSVHPLRGRVLLVDDVITTGATVEACARELLGTASDGVWAVALCAADPARPSRV